MLVREQSAVSEVIRPDPDAKDGLVRVQVSSSQISRDGVLLLELWDLVIIDCREVGI